MRQPASKETLALLLKAYNRPVKDFFYFPDVVLIGSQPIEPEDLAMLLGENYLQMAHADSFGRFYVLSQKGKEVLFTSLLAKPVRRRRKPAAAAFQAAFSFS